MEPSDSDPFVRVCSEDIRNLRKETDPNKQIDLLRRINWQMQGEAHKLGYDNHSICSMFYNDMAEYTKQATPIHDTKLDEEMEKLKFNVPKADKGQIFKPKFAKKALELIKAKKCETICKKELPSATTTSNNISATSSSSNSLEKPPQNVQNAVPMEIEVDKPSDLDENVKEEFEEELTFDVPFKPKVNFFRPDPEPIPPKLSSYDARNRYEAEEIQNSRRAKGRIVPSKFVVTPIYYSTTKRRPDDDYDSPSSSKATKSVYDNYAGRPSANNEEEIDDNAKNYDFKTASDELQAQHQMRYGASTNQPSRGQANFDRSNYAQPNGNSGIRRSIGLPRIGLSRPPPGKNPLNRPFVSPMLNNNPQNAPKNHQDRATNGDANTEDSRLKNVDQHLIERIENEIMENFAPVEWDKVAGLEGVKKIIKEAVVLPMLRPDIFTGMRRPPRGILLFGPPGTGKTMIGRCIASQSNATFFSISASSLMSKWIGEAEKTVRALFGVAAKRQPAVIFIDEIDSLLCQRTENENECSRRIKTEFLVQLDGAATSQSERILIVGATNRPQELDEAARRRLVRRLYIPLPEPGARKQILQDLLQSVPAYISDTELEDIASKTEGFSGADMSVLCHEAVMEPVRNISYSEITNLHASQIRPVAYQDFRAALKSVRASVSQKDLQQYIDWNEQYGTQTNHS